MRVDVDEDRLVVISDLHLGNPYSLATRRLGSFVDYLIEEEFNLCINGDGVDILQGRLAILTQTTLEVLDLLRRFGANGRRTYYVVGNHDVALEGALHTWLGDYLTPFLNVSSGGARVRIEHGHVYDPFYAAAPRLYAMLGTAAAPMLRVYPDLYRAWSATARLRQRAVRLLPSADEAGAAPEQAAAKMIANRGFDVVVFGHTHRAERLELPHGGLYLNCGNWLRESSFVQIADGQASLLKWEDKPQPWVA
jgi:UDP-2,3-diacylglucosamine pyrophosphatase LpxH